MQGIRAKHFLAKPGETSTTFAKTYKTKYYIEFDGRRPKRLVIKRPSASSRNGYRHRADAPRDRTRAALLASVGEGMTDQASGAASPLTSCVMLMPSRWHARGCR